MMPWWIWVVGGMALMGLELMMPGGFFLMFFGLSAVVVGVLASLALAGPLWSQIGLFALLSALSLLFFRGRVLAKFKPDQALTKPLDDLVGGVVILSADLAPGAVGKAEHRGTNWTVRNLAGVALAKETNSLIVPANVGDVAGMIQTAMAAVGRRPAAPAQPQG